MAYPKLMTTRLLATLMGTAVAVSAMAQGTLNFDNFVDPNFLKPIYGSNPDGSSQSGQSPTGLPAGTTIYGGPLLQDPTGTRYIAQSWVGLAGVTDSATLTLATSSPFAYQGS